MKKLILILLLTSFLLSAKEVKLDVPSYRQYGNTCVISSMVLGAAAKGYYQPTQVGATVKRFYPNHKKGCSLDYAAKLMKSKGGVELARVSRFYYSKSTCKRLSAAFKRTIKHKEANGYSQWAALKAATDEQMEYISTNVITDKNSKLISMWKRVKEQIDKGSPLVIATVVRQKNKGYGHTRLITGYDDKKKVFFITDTWGSKHVNKEVKDKTLCLITYDMFYYKK